MPAQINIRFHAELNEILPPALQHADFEYESKKLRSVKDLIESLGVPHSEIDLIIVNGESVDFSFPVQGGEHIHVYPASSSHGISAAKRIHPNPISDHRFVLDVHLGRLAAYLRMTGFDTLYRNDYDDPTLAQISANQDRILITCDRKLLMRKIIKYGYFMRSRIPAQQIREVLSRFSIYDQINTLARCIQCNGLIHPVNKQQIEARLLPLTKRYYQHFYQCSYCQKIYWKGSHYFKMKRLIERFKAPHESA